MTATAQAEATIDGGRRWVAGIAAPVACLLVDVAAGGQVLKLAPAAILAVAGLGIASFAISRNRRRRAAGLAAIGPLWLVCGVALTLGSALAAISGLGAIIVMFSGLPETGALSLLEWAVLAFAPLWTGVAYLQEARALTEDQAAAFGPRQAGIAALVGIAAAAAFVYGAHSLSSWLIWLMQPPELGPFPH
jgi:hypothetical protein